MQKTASHHQNYQSALSFLESENMLFAVSAFSGVQETKPKPNKYVPIVQVDLSGIGYDQKFETMIDTFRRAIGYTQGTKQDPFETKLCWVDSKSLQAFFVCSDWGVYNKMMAYSGPLGRVLRTKYRSTQETGERIPATIKPISEGTFGDAIALQVREAVERTLKSYFVRDIRVMAANNFIYVNFTNEEARDKFVNLRTIVIGDRLFTISRAQSSFDKKLFLGFFEPQTGFGMEMLSELLKAYGLRHNGFYIPLDKVTNKPRGFAYVFFNNDQDRTAAFYSPMMPRGNSKMVFWKTPNLYTPIPK